MIRLMDEIPPFYKQLNTKSQNIVIHLGCAAYKHLFSDLSEKEIINMLSLDHKVQELYNTMEELKKINRDDRNSYLNEKNKELDNQRSNLQKTYSEEVERLKKDIERKENEIEKNKQDYKQRYTEQDELWKQKNELIEKTKDKENSVLKGQLSQYNSMFGKTSHSNTKEKGEFAEKWIQTLVDKGLPFDEDATFLDTSEIKGSGDGILSLKKYKQKIMVEMKNKIAIDEHDLKQFTEHSVDDFMSKKVDLSILISFNNTNIRGQGCCSIPKYDKSDPRMIYFGLSKNLTIDEKSLKLIDTIQEICLKHQQKQTEEVIDEQFSALPFIESTIKRFMEDENILRKELKDDTKRRDDKQKQLDKLCKTKNDFWRQIWLSEFISKIDKRLLENSNNEGIIKQCLIDKIKREMKEKNVDLAPINSSGNRSNWRNRLKEDLNLELQEYEKKIYQKLKHTELTN